MTIDIHDKNGQLNYSNKYYNISKMTWEVYNIIITHSERALFNLNARLEARGTILPKAVGRWHYCPKGRYKGI